MMNTAKNLNIAMQASAVPGTAVNAVIYARYSSHSQTEQSIEGQLAVCERYALERGYRVVATYVDRAITGKTDNRPQFQKMIADSNKRQFEVVLVYQLDRFSRERYDNAIYKNKLRRNGVRVVSAMEPISNDASGILMESVLEGMAEYYSEELRQKVTRGLERSLENGTVLGGSTPLGFKIERRDNKPYYVVDEQTAPVVRKIFEMYLANHTMAEIIVHLNNQGITTSQGNPYNKNSIRRILTNKRYLGTYVHKGKEYPGKMPAIIDEDVFEQAQVMMEKNKKAPARAKALDENYLLTTKLFCGHCRAPMTGVCGTSKSGGVYQYYSCVTARKRGSSCIKANVRKDVIEEKVVRAALKILTDENIQTIAREMVAISEQEGRSANLPRLKKQLRENAQAQKNLIKAIEEGKALDALVGQLEKRQQEQAVLEVEIARETLQTVAMSEGDVVAFLQRVRSGSVKDPIYRQSLIDIFVNAIYLYDTDEDKNKKLNIIFNVQGNKKEVPIDDNMCSSMGTLVGN